jgi:hypothetical protein
VSAGCFFFQFDDTITPTRPYIDMYVRTPNRLALGERTVIVMSSKVAQKSYGTEKRCVFTWSLDFLWALNSLSIY